VPPKQYRTEAVSSRDIRVSYGIVSMSRFSQGKIVEGSLVEAIEGSLVEVMEGLEFWRVECRSQRAIQGKYRLSSAEADGSHQSQVLGARERLRK
jgi:hypothetical protein